jgi:hypothetical protein
MSFLQMVSWLQFLVRLNYVTFYLQAHSDLQGAESMRQSMTSAKDEVCRCRCGGGAGLGLSYTVKSFSYSVHLTYDIL